jgi:hypothetical protein
VRQASRVDRQAAAAPGARMEYDRDKVDEVTLALLYLVASKVGEGGRAWKTFDAPTVERLWRKGLIRDLRSRAATVDLTAEGMKKAEELFRKYFQSP